MRIFSKLISHIFNPLFFPLAGSILYFFITPKFNPPEAKRLILLAILILTVIIPFIFFLLLRNLGWITNNGLTHIKERKIPLYIFIIVIYITIMKITTFDFSIELYYYFIGILGALLSCLIMIYFNFKASMHMMGICGLTTFILGLSFHYEINITLGLSLLVLITGIVATARLYLKSHTYPEIIIGCFIGVITQFLTFGYWL